MQVVHLRTTPNHFYPDEGCWTGDSFLFHRSKLLCRWSRVRKATASVTEREREFSANQWQANAHILSYQQCFVIFFSNYPPLIGKLLFYVLYADRNTFASFEISCIVSCFLAIDGDDLHESPINHRSSQDASYFQRHQRGNNHLMLCKCVTGETFQPALIIRDHCVMGELTHRFAEMSSVCDALSLLASTSRFFL